MLHNLLDDKASDAIASVLDTFSSRLQESPLELLAPADEYTAAATKLLDGAADALEQYAVSSRLLHDHSVRLSPGSYAVDQ